MAIAALAERVTAGRVVGVDPSPVLLRQASRRSAVAIRAGLVELHMAPVEDLPQGPRRPVRQAPCRQHGRGLARPAVRLAELAGRMRPGGRVALVSQPRCPGATAETVAAGRELAGYLREAGFSDLRTETLDLRPPAVCVLGRR